MTTIGIHVTGDKLHGSWYISGTPQPYNVESIRDCICLAEDEILFGDEAWERREEYPGNTVYSFRNLLSLRPETEESTGLHHPFQLTVVEDHLMVPILLNKTHKLHAVEELLGRLVGHLKKRIEKKLDCPVTGAVLAVPVEYRSQSQINSLKSAVEFGGLQTVSVLSEHHARVIYSAQRLNWSGDKNVVVFEADPARSNLSIFSNSDGKVRCLWNEETTQMSEESINRRLADFCIKEYTRRFGTNPPNEELIYQQCVDAADKFVDKTFTLKVEPGKTVQICLNDYLIVRQAMSKDMLDFVEHCLNEVNLSVGSVNLLIHNLGDQLLKALQDLLHLTNAKCTMLIASCTDVHFGLALVAAQHTSVSTLPVGLVKPSMEKAILPAASAGRTIVIEPNYTESESPGKWVSESGSGKEDPCLPKRLTPSPGTAGVPLTPTHHAGVHSALETARPSVSSGKTSTENSLTSPASTGPLKTSSTPTKHILKRLATRKTMVENLFTIRNELQSGTLIIEAPLSVVTNVRTKCEALLFRFCTSEVMEFEELTSIQEELKRLWKMLTSSSRKAGQIS